MRYKNIVMCINRDEKYYKEEKEYLDKYYPMMANKQVADEKGYFFAVLEAELIEISAVVKGSNVVTPTVSVTESKGAVIDTPTDIEPTIKVTPDFSKINFITIKTN